MYTELDEARYALTGQIVRVVDDSRSEEGIYVVETLDGEERFEVTENELI